MSESESRNCLYCHEIIISKRKGAKFCSDYCRKANFYYKDPEKEVLITCLENIVKHKKDLRTLTKVESDYWVNQFRLCILEAEAALKSARDE